MKSLALHFGHLTIRVQLFDQSKIDPYSKNYKKEKLTSGYKFDGKSAEGLTICLKFTSG